MVSFGVRVPGKMLTPGDKKKLQGIRVKKNIALPGPERAATLLPTIGEDVFQQPPEFHVRR